MPRQAAGALLFQQRKAARLKSGASLADSLAMNAWHASCSFLLLFAAVTGEADTVRSEFPAAIQHSLNVNNKPFSVLFADAKQPITGQLVMIGDRRDAVHSAGPLLELRDHLRVSGWSIRIILREADDGDDLALRSLATIDDMTPTVGNSAAAPERKRDIKAFLLAQGDAATLIVANYEQLDKHLAGLILLSAAELPAAVAFKELPVLDIVSVHDWASVLDQANLRHRQWQDLPHYRQDWLNSNQHDFFGSDLWLSHRLDGWMRTQLKAVADTGH